MRHRSHFKYPTLAESNIANHNNNTGSLKDSTGANIMYVLVNSLRRTPIFAHLSARQVEALIKHSRIYTAASGTKISAPENAVKHHLLILDGNIKSQNKWLFHGDEMQYCWQLQSDESLCRFAILSSATRAMNATATTRTRYLFIDGDEVESLQTMNTLGSQQTESNTNTLNTELLKLAV